MLCQPLGPHIFLFATMEVVCVQFFSYVTATFVIETMACVNALKRGTRQRQNV